jgi:hypothetical protein
MPVTAKFSEEFYARLGHRVADELVDWFNRVDDTYRSEFRELFAAHFRAFDAKLDQRTAELREEIARLETRLIRWMFLFWVGTLGTMVALFRFWAG